MPISQQERKKNMRVEYLNDLDLGEEGGVRNVLVTPETVESLPEGVRGWATLADTAKLIGKSESYTRDLAYQGAFPSRWFKKRETDRMGICLIPVADALAYRLEEANNELRGYKTVIEETLRIPDVGEAKISEMVEKYRAAVENMIHRVKGQGGLSREKH
jgi:hypothetical protein